MIKTKFTVKCNMKGIARIYLVFMFAILFGLIWTIVKDGVSPYLALVIVPVGILPCLAAYLFLTLTYVKVNNSQIEFRNMFGIKRHIDVHDINRVIWKVSYTQFGTNEKVTIKSGCKSFSVETLMVNSEKFFEYITSNVAEEKIIKKRYTFVSPKSER